MILVRWFLIVCLLDYHVSRAYVPQEPLVEPLTPIGLRISIPHDKGITLVAFHMKINENFNELEAETKASYVLRQHGRWIYEDRSTKLKRGDVIYYWVQVVYKGHRYNLNNQQYIVTDFFDYKGQRIESQQENNNNDKNPGECVSSLTKVYEVSGNSRYPCAGQLLFQDDFHDLAQFRRMQWQVVGEFSDLPDFEFVVYRNSERNYKVSNGLKITPKLLSDEHDDNFILEDKLTLKQCTKRKGTTDCSREARGWNILPPVTSARVNTQNSFLFEHGRVEIRAKLPQGDWIYPLLMLESAYTRDILQIRIASSNGNAKLRTKSGREIGGHLLWGGITGFDPNVLDERINDNTATSRGSDLWSRRYHTYEIVWSPNRMVLRVDGDVFEDRKIDLPRNTPFFLTLGVAVGGLSEFPDNSTSGSYLKPWRNVEAKALYHFYNSTGLWYPTWQEGSNSLEVDYVKIYAL